MSEQASILLIDDDLNSLQMLEDILCHRGFDIQKTTNGKTGVQLAQQEQPDLILLDVNMLDVDGFEICRWLKAEIATKQIPVIFLTVRDNVEDKLHGFNVGGVDYIVKPFNVKEVLARINSHISQCRVQQNLAERLHAYEQRFGPLDNGQTLSTEINEEHADYQQIVWQACDHLLGNLSQTPSLDKIANTIGTNRNKLSQEFSDFFGKTVFGWLREQRFQESCRLLRETHYTIRQISEIVGYTDANYFSARFKHRFGISPREFRRRFEIKSTVTE